MAGGPEEADLGAARTRTRSEACAMRLRLVDSRQRVHGREAPTRPRGAAVP